MLIETGKRYLTRDGSTAIINYNTEDLGFNPELRPFGGEIRSSNDTRSAFFTENGMYLGGKEHRFDIVKEIDFNQ